MTDLDHIIDHRLDQKINTKRLAIVPFTMSMISDEYLEWMNDPDVLKFSNQRFVKHTVTSCHDYIMSYENSPHFLWAIVTTADNRHIGNINAYIATHHNTADMGILIGKKTIWGQGYGFEAWQAVCRFLFDTRAIRKITAGTLTCNSAMIKIAKKSGMIEEGKKIRQEIVAGEEIDVIYFGLFNSRL